MPDPVVGWIGGGIAERDSVVVGQRRDETRGHALSSLQARRAIESDHHYISRRKSSKNLNNDNRGDHRIEDEFYGGFQYH